MAPQDGDGRAQGLADGLAAGPGRGGVAAQERHARRAPDGGQRPANPQARHQVLLLLLAI